MLTPIKAIRARCLDCCGGQKAEVRLCPSQKCPLWPYRMGRRPKDGETPAKQAGDGKTASWPHVLGKCGALGKRRALVDASRDP